MGLQVALKMHMPGENAVWRSWVSPGGQAENLYALIPMAFLAVDTNTESELLGHLRGYHGSCTVVIVRHRISSVTDNDLILVLEDGIISERPTIYYTNENRSPERRDTTLNSVVQVLRTTFTYCLRWKKENKEKHSSCAWHMEMDLSQKPYKRII